MKHLLKHLLFLSLIYNLFSFQIFPMNGPTLLTTLLTLEDFKVNVDIDLCCPCGNLSNPFSRCKKNKKNKFKLNKEDDKRLKKDLVNFFGDNLDALMTKDLFIKKMNKRKKNKFSLMHLFGKKLDKKKTKNILDNLYNSIFLLRPDFEFMSRFNRLFWNIYIFYKKELKKEVFGNFVNARKAALVLFLYFFNFDKLAEKIYQDLFLPYDESDSLECFKEFFKLYVGKNNVSDLFHKKRFKNKKCNLSKLLKIDFKEPDKFFVISVFEAIHDLILIGTAKPNDIRVHTFIRVISKCGLAYKKELRFLKKSQKPWYIAMLIFYFSNYKGTAKKIYDSLVLN